MLYDQVFLLVLLVALFAAFVRGPLRYDVTAFVALLVAVLFGPVPVDQAFSGFGHGATITVAAVLVISRSLMNSGAVDIIARRLMPPLGSPTAQIGVMSGVAASMSAVMNNVGALALLMPSCLRSAARAGHAPGLVLMPLSFASLLGGLVTLIGTPPNIIVSAYRGERLGTPFAMFDFSPVGGAVAVAGVVFVALVGWRLLPRARRKAVDTGDLFEIESYVSEAHVPADSKAIGKTLDELDEATEALDAVILGLVRQSHRRVGRREEVRAGDVILIEAKPDEIGAVLEAIDAQPSNVKDEERTKLRNADVATAEIVVPQRSQVTGRTLGELQLRRRFGIEVLGVSRQGRPHRGRLRAFRVGAGDVMLLQGDPDRLPNAIRLLGLLPLAERELQLARPHRAGLTALIFGAAVAAAAAGLVPIPIALSAVAAALVVLNIVSPRELYDSIDWTVVVLLAALIPIGAAMQQTGTTALIAGGIAALVADLPAGAVLVVVLVLAMTLSDVLNNAATAVVMAPIAVDLALGLGADPDPFLMAVAIGASCAFLTPIGHQNNILIMGPGGYGFGDYWRMGLPLEILIVAVAIPMLLLVWPP